MGVHVSVPAVLVPFGTKLAPAGAPVAVSETMLSPYGSDAVTLMVT